jgi:hypothetical protein
METRQQLAVFGGLYFFYPMRYGTNRETLTSDWQAAGRTHHSAFVYYPVFLRVTSFRASYEPKNSEILNAGELLYGDITRRILYTVDT